MPIDYTKYPPFWAQFSAWIRHERAGDRCECTGQCGIHQPNPHPRRCTETHAHPARWFKGKVVLTVAHLCACKPPCARHEHVIAACQRCHLRIDRFLHAANSRGARLANAARRAAAAAATGVAKSTAPCRLTPLQDRKNKLGGSAP